MNNLKGKEKKWLINHFQILITSSEIADVETALVVAHSPLPRIDRKMSNDKGSFNVGDLTAGKIHPSDFAPCLFVCLVLVAKFF